MSDDGGVVGGFDMEGGEGAGGGGPITEVSHENLGERLQSSCMGICVGLLLFFGSFPLLFWNEHRAVERYDALNEAESQTLEIADPYAALDPANDGKLIHFTANITNGGDGLADPTFGISPGPDALRLWRDAEMYQWVERSQTSSKKTTGGGKTTTTTYSYDKQWKSGLVSSSSFKQSGYNNPTTMEFTDYDATASPIYIGSYELPAELRGRINWQKDLIVSANDVTDESIRSRIDEVPGGYLYFGDDYNNPRVGDQRVRFRYTPESVISIVGVQNGKTLGAFVSESGEGGDVLLFRQGAFSSTEMFDAAEAENAFLSWILRVVGWLLMSLGLYLVFRPIEVFADIIPCVGSIVGCGLIFMAVFISSFLSALTISLAWLTAHPEIGAIVLVSLLAVIGCCAFGAKALQKRMGKDEDDDEYGPVKPQNVPGGDSVPVAHAVPESDGKVVNDDADPEIAVVPTVYSTPEPEPSAPSVYVPSV